MAWVDVTLLAVECDRTKTIRKEHDTFYHLLVDHQQETSGLVLPNSKAPHALQLAPKQFLFLDNLIRGVVTVEGGDRIITHSNGRETVVVNDAGLNACRRGAVTSFSQLYKRVINLWSLEP